MPIEKVPMHKRWHVVVGAGVAGLTAALGLLRHGKKRVVLLERNQDVGGLAGRSSTAMGHLDLGSHRIHPEYAPRALKLIQELLGSDLLTRPRNGRIWIHHQFTPYPPTPTTLLKTLGPIGSMRFLSEAVGRQISKNHLSEDTFETYLKNRLGNLGYSRFFAPYARKLWGVEGCEISFEPAVARARKFELHRLWKRLGQAPNSKRIFLYPKRGFYSLSEALSHEVKKMGGHLLLGHQITQIVASRDQIQSLQITDSPFEGPLPVENLIWTGDLQSLSALGITSRQRVAELNWRGLTIVFLRGVRLQQPESETFYFPDDTVPFGRISVPARYSRFLDPQEDWVTCEIPGEIAKGSEKATVLAGLKKVGLLSPHSNLEAAETHAVYLPSVYPIYRVGWRQTYREIQSDLAKYKNLFCLGRNATFLHCNVDHSMEMALDCVDALASGVLWSRNLETHHHVELHD